MWGSFIWPNAQAPKWDTGMPHMQAVMRLCCMEGIGPGVRAPRPREGATGVSMGTDPRRGQAWVCAPPPREGTAVSVGPCGRACWEGRERKPGLLAASASLPASLPSAQTRVFWGGCAPLPSGRVSPVIVHPFPLEGPSWKPEGAQAQVFMALLRSSSQDAHWSPPFSLWQWTNSSCEFIVNQSLGLTPTLRPSPQDTAGCVVRMHPLGR